MKKLNKNIKRQNRVRKKLKNRSVNKIRLTVFRSSRHIYAQIVDDIEGKTLASASSLIKDSKVNGSNIEAATMVGTLIGKRSIEAGIKDVFFDRGKYKYHGRVKALAEGAREAGLNF